MYGRYIINIYTNTGQNFLIPVKIFVPSPTVNSGISLNLQPSTFCRIANMGIGESDYVLLAANTIARDHRAAPL